MNMWLPSPYLYKRIQ